MKHTYIYLILLFTLCCNSDVLDIKSQKYLKEIENKIIKKAFLTCTAQKNCSSLASPIKFNSLILIFNYLTIKMICTSTAALYALNTCWTKTPQVTLKRMIKDISTEKDTLLPSSDFVQKCITCLSADWLPYDWTQYQYPSHLYLRGHGGKKTNLQKLPLLCLRKNQNCF